MDGHGGYLGGLVQLEVPDKGRAELACQEAAGPLADDLRMQRDPAVRRIECLSPAARLAVQRAAGRHEGGNVGDGVEDPVAAAGRLNEQGLVKVGGRLRIDGEEVNAGQVGVRKLPGCDGGLGITDGVCRIGARQFQLAPERAQCLLEGIVVLVDIRGQPMM